MIGGGFPSGRMAVSIWSHAPAGPFIMKARFFLWCIYKFSRPHPSRSVPRPDGQSGVLLHRFVPRIVLGTVQGYIVFVRCCPARCQEWFGIRSNRMPQLPGSAFNNFEDLRPRDSTAWDSGATRQSCGQIGVGAGKGNRALAPQVLLPSRYQ